MISAVIFGLVVLLGLACIPLFRDQKAENARIAVLQAQVAKERAQLFKNTREEKLLRTDPAYVETIARDKLDLMKPGETIFRLEPGGNARTVSVEEQLV